MKKRGILNRHLSHLVALMGYRDFSAVLDSGFPVWSDFCTDSSIVAAKPGMIEVLSPRIEELEVEKVIIPEEVKKVSPKCLEKLLRIVPREIEIEDVPHERFKSTVNDEPKGVMRTEERTSCSSVILVGEVTYHGKK